MMILVFNLLETSKPDDEMVFTDFITKLQQDEVSEVTIKKPENLIVGTLKSGAKFKSYAPDYPDLIKELREKNVKISAKPDHTPWYMNLLFNFGPVILLVFLWVFFMRQMQTGGNKALSFGRSRAKLISEKGIKVTFADVAGIEEAKEEVQEIIAFLKDPQRFQKLGGKIPKGVMLVGPLDQEDLACRPSQASWCSVPSISGSDFVEMFVGVGASSARPFEQAKEVHHVSYSLMK
jgi:cell division protease FtsH